MGRSTMPGDRRKHSAVLIAWWVVLAMPFAGGPAAAQNSSYISNNTSVIVDTEVLDSLGGAPLAGDGSVVPRARQAVDVQRKAPAPLPSPRVAQLPSPATAPRSRLNPDAMARLGFRQIPPVQAIQQAVAKPPAPAPKSRAVAAVPPAPAVAPKPAATQAAATAPSPVRQATKVPARPVLPTAQSPATAVTRPAVKQTSVAPPPPPAAPAPLAAPAARQPTIAAALVPPKQAAPVARGDDDGLRLLFDNGSAKLSDSARGNLQSLTEKMGADEALQVQLVAYAEGTAETSSQARRLSLSRALAVRSFLIDQGVRSTRMDIRALGNKAEDGPADRVDVVLVQK